MKSYMRKVELEIVHLPKVLLLYKNYKYIWIKTRICFYKLRLEELSRNPVVKFMLPIQGTLGSITGQGTKILHMPHGTYIIMLINFKINYKINWTICMFHWLFA